MGLSISDAIRLLMLRIADEQRLPFEVKVPNAATRRAMAELEQGKGKRFESAEAMLEDLGIEVRVPVRSGQFRRDVKCAQRRGIGFVRGCRELRVRAAYPRTGRVGAVAWG